MLGETRWTITIILVLVPAALYGLGLMGGGKGRLFLVLGLITHLAGMLFRAACLGRVPLTEKHDTISFTAFVMALTYLLLIRYGRSDEAGTAAVPLITLTLLISLGWPPIDTVSPFMRSEWFYLHAFFFFSSMGLFGIAASSGLFFLLKGDADHESDQYLMSLFGWILFSISLAAGSIWFYAAYGTYWIWTARELWTTAVWFIYGLYLHSRMMKGLRGRPAAVIGAAAFAVAVFSYFGIGTIIPSPPTQF